MANREQDIARTYEGFKASSHNLMNEGFKAEALLNMMNNCADKCQLQYRATGIQN